MIMNYNEKLFIQEAKDVLYGYENDNEKLLTNIVEMLSNKSFSMILESKYKKKYISIQEKVKKLKDIDINSSSGEKLLLKVYRNLKSILSETRIKINLNKPKKDKFLSDYYSGIGSINSQNFDLEWYSLQNIFTETDKLYFKILSKRIKDDDHRIKSFNFEELKSIFIIKQNIDLEKLRGRAPGNLTYIS